MGTSFGSRLEGAHALLDAAPVDDGPGLEDVELAAEALALLLEVDDGRLAGDDAVDGAGGGGHVGRGEGVAGAVARPPGRGRGGPAEGGAELGGRETGPDDVEARRLHVGGVGGEVARVSSYY